MSLLLRFLGLEHKHDVPAAAEGSAIQTIARQLAGLEPERARFFAAFAYVLARVAGADLRIEDCEAAEMKRMLVRISGIPGEEAELVVQIAASQMHRLGASDNYLVTREFRRMATPGERIRLLECLFTVAAADDSITSDESSEIMNIAHELGLSRSDALAVRAGFKDKLAEFKRLPGEVGAR